MGRIASSIVDNTLGELGDRTARSASPGDGADRIVGSVAAVVACAIDESRREISTLIVAMSAGASCATIYAPPLVPGQVAQVRIVVPSEPVVDFDGYRPAAKALDVFVHDYANGCPVVEATRTNKGFRGKIEAARGATTSVSVPAGRRLTFTTKWASSGAPPPIPPLIVTVPMAMALSSSCTSVVSFVPERGRTYVIRLPIALDSSKRACGATAEIEGTPPDNRGPAELIAYPQTLRGAEAFRLGGLCALGAD